jgi:UDP-N-acetylglucosamine diphosphorylase/glucosamine-1-phosphate N-acetyltransferase
MRLCLVEDRAAADLVPLTLTRTTFDLLLGSTPIGAKIMRAFGVEAHSPRLGMLVRPQLAASLREREPRAAVNDRDWLARGPVLVANGRWVPPAGLRPPGVTRPLVGLCGGRPACAWVGPGQAVALDLHGVDAWFEEVAGELECVELGGEWIARPWDLIARNAYHLARDFAASGRVGLGDRPPSSVALVGPAERLFIHETARIDPYTVFDTTNGPITIEAGAVVQPFTRVEGPCYVGRDTQLFRANLRGGVTLGPDCRIGGEVEASIVHGHSNKYHEGFLGHAYVGEWVNLGAITSNSDLRNDYGAVSVPLMGDPVATGQTKVGCFIGDHSRTGMGSMLNTGTSVGVMCNVLPAGLLLPKHVPSFAAVLHGRVAAGLPLEQLFATARVVKGRRGQAFTSLEEQLYLGLYEQTRLERERAFQKANERRGERWPLAAAASL